MIKVAKKSNKNVSKQGVILVTVLFILAMAMIFIASAILMTNGTRNRVYRRAEESQSRLTVTSIAESFIASLQMQEISDDDFDTLCSRGAVIKVTSSGIPGLAGVGYGEGMPAELAAACGFGGGDATDLTDYSIMKFDVDNGKNVVVFYTQIGHQSDSVRFTMGEVVTVNKPHLFEYNVETFGDTNFGECNVGVGVGGDKGAFQGRVDNIVMSRGTTSKNQGGTANYYCTFVTTGLFNTDGSSYNGDFVFSGPDALLGNNISGSAFNNCPAIYFIDNRINDAATAGINYGGTCGEFAGSGTSLVVNNSNITNLPNNYQNNYLKDTGNVRMYTTGSTTIGISGAVSASLSSATNPDLGRNNTRYQNARYYAEENVTDNDWGTVSATLGLPYSGVPAGTVGFSYTNNAVNNLNPGSYQLTGDIGDTSGSQGPTIIMDLSKGDYFFYVTSDVTINSGYFVAVNGNGTHNAYFILSPNVNLTIGVTDSKVARGIADADVVGGLTSFNTLSGSGDSFYAAINQSAKPHIYVYGQGNNTVRNGANNNSVLTAYVALLANGDIPAGQFTCYNGRMAFYGRINAGSIRHESGGNWDIPFCPGPYEEEDYSTPTPISTKYYVTNVDYYYY